MACASRSTTRIGGSSISSSRSCASSLSPNALTPVCSFLKLPAVPTLLLLPDLDARPRDGAQRRQDSLSCPIGRQPCCRPIGRSQSRPTSSSTSIFDAFDASRAADADQAADRPRRRPWWASASIRARQQRQPSQAAPADRRADAVGGLQCSRCMAICGALDVQGAVDTGRAADRPQRRPWWAAERL